MEQGVWGCSRRLQTGGREIELLDLAHDTSVPVHGRQSTYQMLKPCSISLVQSVMVSTSEVKAAQMSRHRSTETGVRRAVKVPSQTKIFPQYFLSSQKHSSPLETTNPHKEPSANLPDSIIPPISLHSAIRADISHGFSNGLSSSRTTRS